MSILNEIKNKMSMIRLYRGMENKFDSEYDLSNTDAPIGYSTWTDNLDLAKQYAGKNGYVYQIDLPKEELGNEIIDSDGERALFVNNQKSVGINGVSGDEYLVYTYHELYDPNMVKLVKEQSKELFNTKEKE